jgi:UDPglucose 6-dehydrogenase
VVQVAEAIADHMNGYKVVVTKSTVPIGTGALIEKILRERTGGRHPFSVVSNPEFLREGSAIEDFMNPDRVVIGVRDAQAAAILRDIYAPLATLEVPFVVTNVETSELIKYASNAFLATKITFINECAALCERLGADVTQVSRGMGLDERIGPSFLHPGPGYGGSCFPKDTHALVDIANQAGMHFEIVETVVAVNEKMKQRAARKVLDAAGEVRGKTVAVLGLAFKGGTDDIRDSPAIEIVRALLAHGAKVRTFDAAAMDNARQLLPEGVTYCEDAYDAAKGAEALVIATEWNEFRLLDLERVKKSLAQPVIIDLRNLYDPAKMKDRGFVYTSMGRGAEVMVTA